MIVGRCRCMHYGEEHEDYDESGDGKGGACLHQEYKGAGPDVRRVGCACKRYERLPDDQQPAKEVPRNG